MTPPPPPPPRSGGRPSSLTPAVVRRIVEGILSGESLPNAARSAGISMRTIQRWRRRADEEERQGTPGPASAFVRATAEAAAQVQKKLTQKVLDAALENQEIVTEIICPETGRTLRKKVVRRGPDPHLALRVLSKKDPAGWGSPAQRRATGVEEAPRTGVVRFYDLEAEKAALAAQAEKQDTPGDDTPGDDTPGHQVTAGGGDPHPHPPPQVYRPTGDTDGDDLPVYELPMKDLDWPYMRKQLGLPPLDGDGDQPQPE